MLYTITDYGFDPMTQTWGEPITIENVNVINEPELFFEEIEVILTDGISTGWYAGPHTWNRLETTSDLSPVYGKFFRMVSEYWEVEECIVCADKKSIYYKYAQSLK